MVMGLGPRFCVFSSYGSLLCILHFVVRSFVWTLILCFFFSCCLVRCFSFIYLFIYLTNWDATNELLVGKMEGTNFFFLILANSLFSFPLNKQGAATKHLKTRQLFYCFSLFSFQQTNKGIHLPHTPLDRGPTNSQAHITQLEIFYLFISLSVE
jgi:hypothetical protein